MPISRSQMERQLRMGGGIMNAMPRQQYGLGSFVKSAVKGVTGAVKGAVSGVKDIVSSDAGKLALLAAGAYYVPGFGIKAQGGLSPFFSNIATQAARIPGSSYVSDFFTSKPMKKVGEALLQTGVGAAVTGGLDAIQRANLPKPDVLTQGRTAEEIAEVERELRKNYKNLGYSDGEIDLLVEQNLKEYRPRAVAAYGGRIGYGGGSDFGQVADSQGNVGPGTGGYQGGPQGGYGDAEGGGGSDNPTFAPQPEEPPVFNTNEYLKKLMKNSPVSVGNPYDTRLRTQLGPFGLDINTLGILGIDDPRTPEDETETGVYNIGVGGGTSLFGGNLNFGAEYNPKTGPSMGLNFYKQFYKGGRVNYQDGTSDPRMTMASAPDPMDERNMVMETIAMEEFGKPLSDLTEDEIIQIELFMEEMSKKKNKPLPSDPTKPINPFQPKPTGPVLPDRQMAQAGGRMGFALGPDNPETNAMQAADIEGLPLNQNPAGVTELDLRETGGFIPPVGVKEKADDIPAMLANNEFVFTADAVRGMGDGNVNKGAQRMYDMMKKLENGGRV